MKKIIIILLVAINFCSCDDLFTPLPENIKTVDEMYNNPTFAFGVLGEAYAMLPFTSSPDQSDVATDDAVANNADNSFRKISEGQWTSRFNPFDRWRVGYKAIQATNLFLSIVDKVEWSSDPVLKQLFIDRMTGEAYAMRALQTFSLLQAHAGYNSNGELLGIPIKEKYEDSKADFNQKRNSCQECLDFIMKDLDKAISLLPIDYGNVSVIPDKYSNLENITYDKYNRVNGENFRGLLSGRIAMGIKAQVALWAASPAYSNDTQINYVDAAKYSSDLLNLIGGLSGLDSHGNTWYCNSVEIDNLRTGANPKEILWRSNVSKNNSIESNNFPPTLYGNGRVNPTQNFVDAFPMLNGYPIDDANSNYDKSNPYESRDPRLQKYILYNKSTQGTSNSEIITASDGNTIDGLNREVGRSTRTGYYLRKLTRNYVSPDPISPITKSTYVAYIRYTEIFLIYAEAANEAYGPTGKSPNATYSAYDVIKAIRQRAGIDQDDQYLEECKNNKDMMRELIRNERRIELCFEGFRFKDLHRWKVPVDTLNETAKGVNISNDQYNYIEVATPKYSDFMYYAPIPYSETQKYSNLEQNAGW